MDASAESQATEGHWKLMPSQSVWTRTLRVAGGFDMGISANERWEKYALRINTLKYHFVSNGL